MTIFLTNIKAKAALPSHLCLDAPLVAVSWSTAIEFLRTGVAGNPFPHLGLFLAVWAIYLFDRLYDTRRSLTRERQSLRHQFAYRNRKLLFSFLLITISACVFIVLSGRINLFFLQWGGLLSLPVILYFTVFRFLKKHLKTGEIPFKEITISLCFAGGICLASQTLQLSVFLPLSVLFTLNCLIISRSEASEDAHSDPAAYYSTQKAHRLFYIEISLAILACITVWMLNRTVPFQTAVTLSAIFLISILYLKKSGKSSQSLADTALLTPWPVLWISILLG